MQMFRQRGVHSESMLTSGVTFDWRLPWFLIRCTVSMVVSLSIESFHSSENRFPHWNCLLRDSTAALFNKAFSFCLFYGNFCWFFRIFSERDEAKQNKKSTFFSLCIRQIYWTNIFAKQHPSECEGWTDDVVQRKRFVIWLLIPSDG